MELAYAALGFISDSTPIITIVAGVYTMSGNFGDPVVNRMCLPRYAAESFSGTWGSANGGVVEADPGGDDRRG